MWKWGLVRIGWKPTKIIAMKKIYVIVCCFCLSNIVAAQNEFLDFIITQENDTIYGRLRGNKLVDAQGKKHRITEKKVKAYQLHDEIYRLTLVKNKGFFSDENDSLSGAHDLKRPLLKESSQYYLRKIQKERRRDYIITTEMDTIYGRITSPFLSLNKKLTTATDESFVIQEKTVIAYRQKGEKYFFRKKIRALRKGYLQPLYDGEEAKLYVARIKAQSLGQGVLNGDNSFDPSAFDYYYYIERNGNLDYILPQRFFQIIRRIMPENEALLNKIKKREYTYHDIYLVVKYFNETSIFTDE